MLRSALAMASSVRIGAVIKESLERRMRTAILIAIAAGLALVAAMWGLVAGYFALLTWGFSNVQAAGIVAMALFLCSMLVLALRPLMERRRKRPLARAIEQHGAAGAVGLVDEQVGRVVQQVGPLGVLVAAFAIGLAAGRRHRGD